MMKKGLCPKIGPKKIKRETETSLPLMCIDYESFQFKDEQNRPRNKKVMTIFRKKNFNCDYLKKLKSEKWDIVFS